MSLLPWNSDTYMMDYVPNVHRLLQEKASTVNRPLADAVFFFQCAHPLFCR